MKDDGVGIPRDKQDKLFQPFQRAGQETGGIGLVITRRLARLMGGEIGFRSEPGQGSVFWFDIPLRQACEPARESSPIGLEPAPGAARDLEKGALVLYVEDNHANVTFMYDLMSTTEGSI